MSTILVVDDDAAIRAGLCELISLLYERHVVAGELRVVAAASGEEAVAVAAGLAAPPDMVIMDLHLPAIDGVEAYSRIVAARGPVPALFLTGYTGSGPLHRRLGEALASGIAVLAAKPISAADLSAHIDRVLSPHSG